ncbi:caspase family protein [Salmonella enterica]
MSTRHAILISNSKYSIAGFDLDSPDNDIAAIENSLLCRGFTVDKYSNVDANGFDAIFNGISNDNQFGLMLIYYAGHAIEVNGMGYLLPVDLPECAPYFIAAYSFSVDRVLKSLENTAKIKIVVLDSCRNSVRGWEENDYIGFANRVGHQPEIMDYQNVAIAYSTSSGAVAYDGDGISHYAHHLSKYILKHRISIDEVFKNVGALVTQTPPHNQRPWFYSSLNESITFSDLPEYEYLHCVRTPLSGFAISLHYLNRQQVVCGGKTSLYAVNGTEHRPVVHFDDNIIGVEYSDTTGYVVVTDTGRVVSGTFDYAPDFDFSLYVCSKISADGRYIALIATEEIVIVDNKTNSAEKIQSKGEVFYSANFIDNETLWVGTTHGIRIVSCRDKGLTSCAVDIDDALYVYCIEKIDEDIIALSCSVGMILFVNKADYQVINKISVGKTVRTISARRDSIINITTDDEIVHNFLYKPWLIDKDGLALLGQHLHGNNLIYLKASPVDAILIAASDEGIIYFIDRRNFDVYHSIIAGTYSNKIQGISFEHDGTILVLTDDGYVHYYSRGDADYRQAIKYIDDPDFRINKHC